MARVYDRKPRAADDHNPLKNLLDFQDMSPYVEQAGETIRNGLTGIIYELSGLDLSSWDNFLASLDDGKGIDLPGLVTAFNVLKDLVDNLGQAIVDAFNGIPTAIGGVVTDVWNTINGLLGIGRDAQNTADLAMSILLGNVGTGLGTSGSDPFDGTVLTTTPSNYTEVTWGSAANKYYRDGTGKLAFTTGGFLGNSCIYERNDISFIGYATTTGLYLPQAIGSGANILLLNRWNPGTFYGYGMVVSDINVQPVWVENPSGTPIFHNLGSSFPYTQSNGEYWEFDVGDVTAGVMTNDYMLRCRRNGTEVASYDDSSAATYPATGAYKGIAYGGSSGSGFFTFSWAPAIETASYYERL